MGPGGAGVPGAGQGAGAGRPGRGGPSGPGRAGLQPSGGPAPPASPLVRHHPTLPVQAPGDCPSGHLEQPAGHPALSARTVTGRALPPLPVRPPERRAGPSGMPPATARRPGATWRPLLLADAFCPSPGVARLLVGRSVGWSRCHVAFPVPSRRFLSVIRPCAPAGWAFRQLVGCHGRSLFAADAPARSAVRPPVRSHRAPPCPRRRRAPVTGRASPAARHATRPGQRPPDCRCCTPPRTVRPSVRRPRPLVRGHRRCPTPDRRPHPPVTRCRDPGRSVRPSRMLPVLYVQPQFPHVRPRSRPRTPLSGGPPLPPPARPHHPPPPDERAESVPVRDGFGRGCFLRVGRW